MQLGNILKTTIFQNASEIQEMEQRDEQDEIQYDNNKKRLLSQMKQQLRKILYNKQNIYLKENLANLHNRKLLEGFAEDISPTVQQCFYFFSQALANARSLRVLDISGIDLHPLLAIEIGIGLSHNSSLRELHIGSCRMNSFCLQYIFSSLTNHKSLHTLNLFNNQGFTIDLMNDLNQFLFKGKNHIRKVKLTHCNVSTTAMSYLFRNLKSSKSIRELDVSMIHFNIEVLTSLGIALEEYKGKEVLESLNISDCNIKDLGLQTLSQRVNWNIRKINLKELILKSNQITQSGVPHLEALLREINQLQKLDLSYNKIEELNCLELHARKMYEVHLVKNCVSVFPSYFLMYTLVVNLSNNNISTQGAFQLSSLLRQNPLWIELNLTSNQLQSEGFNSLIFGLRDNKMLKKLIVADNQLDGQSIVCYMINHEQVSFEFLDISLNQIRLQLIFVLLNYIKSGCLRTFRCSYLQTEEDSRKSEFNIFCNRSDDLILKSSNQMFQLTSFNLTELDFHGNKNIFSAVVNSLSTYFNKIEKLNLSYCSPITESDIEQLCQFLRKSTMIRDLNLSGLNLGNQSSDSLKRLSDAIMLSNLRCLNLSRNRLYKKMKKLFSINNTTSNYKIESLDLSYNCLEGKHLGSIEKMLTQFRSLSEINLSHNFLNFECLFAINRALQDNGSIKRLNLSYQKLSADDLLILSQSLYSEGLQELNISNNLYATKSKTYFQQCSTKPQEYLKFQHIYFDDSYFQSLLSILKQQKRTLKGITLEACFFKSGQYIEFVRQLHKCKKLEYFANIYNPNLDKELTNLFDSFRFFKSIKSLKLNQIPLPRTFLQGLSEFLSQQECEFISIDFSNTKFDQDSFDTLCKGIAQNTSLKQLILNKCQLGMFDLSSLGQMIRLNRTVEILELSDNLITKLDQFIISLKAEQSFTFFRQLDISENQLECESLIELFSPYNFNIKCLSVSHINLSNCSITNQLLQSLLNSQIEFGDKFLFNDLHSICLSNNQLDEASGKILKDIIVNSPNLQEISLESNLLGSQGSLEIFQGVLKSQSVRTLDLSNNQITDTMVDTITPELLSKQLKSLQFILLRKNYFSQKAQKKLVKMISFQKELFIDQIWSELDDQDAEKILIQYTKIGAKYHLDQQSMPTFIKEIFIQNAFLTDRFSELLAKYYPLLSFIEFIDISDNPYITMFGKVHLFIHIFDQSFAKHNLKALYIGDSQEKRKLYDDGLLRFMLLQFRNFLYPPANHNLPIKSASSQRDMFRVTLDLGKRQAASKIIGGLCGEWILHKINKLMTYLDQIEPPQFIVSTLFIGKFRKNNIQIKAFVALFAFLSLIINLIQFNRMNLSEKYDFDIIAKEYQESCTGNNNSCENFNDHFLYQDYSEIAYQFCAVFVVDLLQLGIGIFLRRKIRPAFQVIHPSLQKYYHSSYPHTQEIIRILFSMAWKISSLPERFLLYYLSFFQYSEIRGNQYRFQTIYYIVQTIIALRFIKFLSFLCYNNFLFLKLKPRKDLAKFLQLFQKSMHYEGYFLISETLVALCPLKGYSITKSIIINEEILISSLTIIFIEIFSVILYVSLYKEYTEYINIRFGGFDPLRSCQILILMTLLKSILSLFIMLFRIFTVRPAVVKQHGFNQGLTLKKFAENRSLFVPSTNFKIDYQNAVPNMEKQNGIFETTSARRIKRQGSEDLGKLDQNFSNKQMEDIQEEDDREDEKDEKDEDQEKDLLNLKGSDNKVDKNLSDELTPFR